MFCDEKNFEGWITSLKYKCNEGQHLEYTDKMCEIYVNFMYIIYLYIDIFMINLFAFICCVWCRIGKTLSVYVCMDFQRLGLNKMDSLKKIKFVDDSVRKPLHSKVYWKLNNSKCIDKIEIK